MNPTDDPRGPVPDADPLDELASAVLDGEAAPGDPALRDQALTNRIAEFERVARVVGAPVDAADGARRDTAIAAALAAWGTTAPGDAPVVDELAAARARRRAGGLKVAGIAAAVAAIAAFGGLVLRGGDSAEDTAASDSGTATANAEAFGEQDADERDDAGDDAGGDAGGETVDSAAGAPPGDPESTASLLGDLGEFADLEALVAAAPTAVQRGIRVDAFLDESGCADPLPDDVVGSATARLAQAPDGTTGPTPVVVAVLDRSGRPFVQVYDAETCELLAERPAP